MEGLDKRRGEGKHGTSCKQEVGLRREERVKMEGERGMEDTELRVRGEKVTENYKHSKFGRKEGS